MNVIIKNGSLCCLSNNEMLKEAMFSKTNEGSALVFGTYNIRLRYVAHINTANVSLVPDALDYKTLHV